MHCEKLDDYVNMQKLFLKRTMWLFCNL